MTKEKMKTNHINFAHPNKWFDSLASPVESPSVATIVIIGNYGKPQKNSKVCENQILGPGVDYAWGRY